MPLIAIPGIITPFCLQVHRHPFGLASGRCNDIRRLVIGIRCNLQGSAREGLHLQSQEILRLVLAGHTAEEIAAPALNPYMRPVIDSKLAPPPSAAMPAGVTAAAGARVSADSAAAVAAAGDGTAANTGPADAAIGILAAAGPAQKHPPSDIIEAVAKTAAATSSVHGGSPGLRAQQLPCAAQASTAEIMKGAAYGEAAGSDTLSMPSATLAPACNSKPLADAAVSLSPKPCTAGASASPTGANTAAPNMVTGSIEAANASSKEKMWTRFVLISCVLLTHDPLQPCSH